MFNFGFNFLNLNPFMNFFMPQYYAFNPFGMYGNYSMGRYYNQQPQSIFQMARPTTYNKAKGEYLVQNAYAGLPAENPDPPMCAKYVKNAVVNSGLGRYVYGNGEDSKYMFRGNMNFKEISANGGDLQKLPAGTSIVYDANTPVYYSDGTTGQVGEFGHVLLATGDGSGISDRFEQEIPMADSGVYAFIPV